VSGPSYRSLFSSRRKNKRSRFVWALLLCGLNPRAPAPRDHRRPAAVKRGIEELVELYGADEAMILTTTYDHALRRRSYELIAEVFRLS